MFIFLIVFLGFIGGIFAKWVWERNTKYDGTMFVLYDGEKTVYSLELENSVENLKYQTQVVFKVDSPEEGLETKGYV